MMDRERMKEIATELAAIRHEISSAKPADHTSDVWLMLAFVQGFVSSAAQAASQAAGRLENQ